MAGEDDPFGHLAETERREAEDAEAERLLAGMVADGNTYLRSIIGRNPYGRARDSGQEGTS